MIYLYETLKLKTATPRQLETLSCMAQEKMLPLYKKGGGHFMAAWVCNARHLFEVTQITELEDLGQYRQFHERIFESNESKEFLDRLNAIAPERESHLYAAPGAVFSASFNHAIEENQHSTENERYTVAQLEVVHHQWPSLVQRNEGAIAAGMPLVTTLKSITGKQNRVINIWKGDFNAPGYQPPEFYDSIGFVEEWWTWIRQVAPQERLLTVSMLPYSPLQ